MSVHLKNLSKSRWDREIHSAESLADDLGVLGSWVGPRTGPFKRTKGQKEDYVLRRLLVAWKQLGIVEWPFQVRAQDDDKAVPDFLLCWPDGTIRGIEVTEAGEEVYQRWLTESVAEIQGKALDVPLEASTQRTVEEIKKAIRRKIRKYDAGAYHDPNSCDLVVYDNTAWGGFLDKRDVIGKLGRPNSLLGRFRQVHLVFNRTVILDVFGERLSVDLSNAYEIDYSAWIFEQVERLRRGATDDLDLQHIAKELEDLGRSERRALRSHLRNLLSHLLKWEHQPERRGASWSMTIDNARIEIDELLTESPSMRGDLIDALPTEYTRARVLAAKECDLPAEQFPEDCPYSKEELVDPDFMPGPPDQT
jgi:Domain of unknown function DUF29